MSASVSAASSLTFAWHVPVLVRPARLVTAREKRLGMDHAFSFTFSKEVVMKTVFLTLLTLSLSSGPLLADKKTDERLANAAKAFDEIMSAPDKGIPGTVLNKAESSGT